MLSPSDVWPLFDLTITSPRLVMRIVRDGDLPGIVAAAQAGIRPDHWTLNFTVMLDGVPIGTQSLGALVAESSAAVFNRPAWDIDVEGFDAVRRDLFVQVPSG